MAEDSDDTALTAREFTLAEAGLAEAWPGWQFRPTSSRSAVQAGPTSGSLCPIRKSYGSSSLSRTWLEGAFPWGDLCRPQVRLMLFGRSAAGPREVSSM